MHAQNALYSETVRRAYHDAHTIIFYTCFLYKKMHALYEIIYALYKTIYLLYKIMHVLYEIIYHYLK